MKKVSKQVISLANHSILTIKTTYHHFLKARRGTYKPSARETPSFELQMTGTKIQQSKIQRSQVGFLGTCFLQPRDPHQYSRLKIPMFNNEQCWVWVGSSRTLTDAQQYFLLQQQYHFLSQQQRGVSLLTGCSASISHFSFL